MWQSISEIVCCKFLLYLVECHNTVHVCLNCDCCCFDEAEKVKGKQDICCAQIYNIVLVFAILMCSLFNNLRQTMVK